MRSRMAGKSILYCSPSLIVVTRLFAAVIASGDGVCADAARVKKRTLPAIANLHMRNPTEIRLCQAIAGLLNSNLRPFYSFFGVELGLIGLRHPDKQVGHF